jgi:hypothetical protein
MPSLGKHDGLAWRFVEEIESIDEARAKYECHVQTSAGTLQFDADSQRRLNAVLLTLTPGDSTSTVEWKMADNSTVTLTYEGLRDLIVQAHDLAGPQLLRAFQHAQTLKARMRAGGRVTLREIASENWV